MGKPSGVTVHNFKESLERSRSYSQEPFWEEVYRKAFIDVGSIVEIPKDGWAQRAGIDRIITLTTGRIIKVDEKVREKDWNDILLERWSDEEKKIPGWIQKPLDCDFIAYAFAPSKTCYLFPTLTLQQAWALNGREWVKNYKEIRANNGSYTTVSCAVPTNILFNALTNAMRVQWGNA